MSRSDETGIDYRSYDGKKGKYRICITLEVFGFLCQETYEVEVTNHASPFALAWKELEWELIQDCEVMTHDCGCCVLPYCAGGDVKFVTETIETLD
jgi:hypothetical protein